jgi:hypothetical protein
LTPGRPVRGSNTYASPSKAPPPPPPPANFKSTPLAISLGA